MHRSTRPVAAVLLAALALAVPATALSRKEKERAALQAAPVLLVSIDGFRADYLDRGLTPYLAMFARVGARAEWLTPSYPTLTFPNHYSLVTGLVPDHHGMVGNRMVDPALGRFTMHDRSTVQDGRWWGGEPIWVTLERTGRKTAPVFWPGSEAAIGGVRPAIWKPFDEALPDEQRVDELLARLDLPAAERPAFLTLYFELVDDAGHDFGPDAPETNAAIAQADRLLGRLYDGLRARKLDGKVNLIVVSDHGMAAIRPDGAVVLDEFVDPSKLDLIYVSSVAHLAPLPGAEEAVQRTLLGAHPHFTCYPPGGFPPAWRYGDNPRVPPITCQAEVGYRFGTREWFAAHADEARGGNHGFPPESVEMRALFIATGPGIERGITVPAFANVHVQALIAALAGVEPPPSDARRAVIAPLLVKALR